MSAQDRGHRSRAADARGGRSATQATGPWTCPGAESRARCSARRSSRARRCRRRSTPGPTGPTGFLTWMAACQSDGRGAAARADVLRAGRRWRPRSEAGPAPLPLGPAASAAEPDARWPSATTCPLLYVADDARAGHPRHRRERPHEPARAGAAPRDQRRDSAASRRPSGAGHQPADARLQAVPLRRRRRATGTLMVFDVTDPVASPHVPMQRPHPELNPFAPPDRLAFSAPVATLAFVQHDWPLPSQVRGHQRPSTSTPACSATRARRRTRNRSDVRRPRRVLPGRPGGHHPEDGTVENFPYRLRGVFAFVTLSNGTIVAIDVDDWDAPCRRPDPMVDAGARPTDTTGTNSGTAVAAERQTGVARHPAAEPDGPGTTTRPVPRAALVQLRDLTRAPGTTLEAVLPRVGARTGCVRTSSCATIRRDGPARAQRDRARRMLFDVNGALVPTVERARPAPLILPTPLPPGFVDLTYISATPPSRTRARTHRNATLASYSSDQHPGGLGVRRWHHPGPRARAGPEQLRPGVRLSFDNPTAQQDQDWTTTYEGALPVAREPGAGYHVLRRLPDAHAAWPGGAVQAPDAGVADASFSSRRRRARASARAASRTGPSGRSARRRCSRHRRRRPARARRAGASPTAERPSLPQWTSDYVEIADDLLASSDPYWAIASSDEQDCWDNGLADDQSRRGLGRRPERVEARYNACSHALRRRTGRTPPPWAAARWRTPTTRAISPSSRRTTTTWCSGASAGTRRTRHAGDPPSSEPPNNRVVVAADPTQHGRSCSAIRCCFHHQATFKVRTGGEWVTVGIGLGLLHHVADGPGRRTGASWRATSATCSRTRARSTSRGRRSEPRRARCR